MLTKQDYKDAIQIQDASNLSGIVHAFSKVVSKIWEEAHEKEEGTDWVNQHPICRLYANKIATLSGGDTFEGFQKAYETCADRAEL